MREIITQVAVLFIVWSLAIELAGWALQACVKDNWWRKFLNEAPPPQPQRQTVSVPRTE